MAAAKKGKGQAVCTVLPESRWDGRLTNSARSTFLNCRQKFEWQYMRRLSPRAPELPFLVGGLVHNGLERMYKKGRFDEAAEREIVEAACDEAAERAMTPEQSDQVWEQKAQVMGILRGYSKLYLKKDLATWKIVEAEKSFAYPMPNGWKAEGKRDMVVRLKQADPRRKLKAGALGLVEHKTASRVDASYVSKLPLDNQIIGYSNSIKKELGVIPDFVTYNVMKKTKLRHGKKETFEAFVKRVEDDYSWNPSEYFYRETLTFTTRDVKRFEEELFRFAVEMERAIDEGYFYKNTGQCTIYGKPCVYMPLCIQGPTRENLSRFRERADLHEELNETPQGE